MRCFAKSIQLHDGCRRKYRGRKENEEVRRHSKRPRKRRNLLLLNKIMIRIKDQKKSLLKN